MRRLPTSPRHLLALAAASLGLLGLAGAAGAVTVGAPGLAVSAAASEPAPSFLSARVTGSAAVHDRPGGGVVTTLGPSTEFGSPQTVSVVERRGRWLGVVTTELPNGEIGWIDARTAPIALGRIAVSVEIDLSRRLLVVHRGEDVLRRVTVGVGRPGSETPIGRFAVTDKLAGSDYGAYYGCCIVALSAHQPNLPPGWTGGDRIAIHGTNDPSSIGLPSSAGCPRAGDEDMRFLMARLPLGTPVLIHP